MNARLHVLFIALALFAGLPAGFAQPTLGIAPAGNQAVLSWPSWRTNYVLQSAPSLASTNWVTLSNAVLVTINNSINVTITNTSSARYFRLCTTNPPVAPARMVFIGLNTFTMGDTLDGEADAIPPVSVTVSDYAIETNLVTQSQWSSVYAYAITHGYRFDSAGPYMNPNLVAETNHPVYGTDWYDAVKWCNARSQQEGLFPVYYTDAALTQVYQTNGDAFVYADWSLNGYRLPTEAEWEKAARAGFSGLRFPWGDTISESQANYDSIPNAYYDYDLGPAGNNTNFVGQFDLTTPVGIFAPNAYGLFDMAGNVEEWCWDWYAGPPYPAGSPYLGGTDPRGPAGTTRWHVARGGDWNSTAPSARCANRFTGIPSQSNSSFGFRCVRTL